MPQSFRKGRGVAILAVFVMTSLLGACAVAPPAPSSRDIAAAWQAHRQGLVQLQSWSFSGRLAVKDKIEESWSAGLRWQQTGESFDIHLSGAFGQGAARLFGHKDYAVIETPERAALTASSAEALMQEQLGWSVPVGGLRYWLVGLPEPGLSERKEFDDAGRLRLLQQSGWQVRYGSYALYNGQQLPRMLELENSRLRARLVIDNWQFIRGAGA
jgi:outer membrane lipoprotein LolB